MPKRSDPRPEISLQPTAGWHCGHFFFRFDRASLRGLSPTEVSDGCRSFAATLDPAAPHAPARLQTMITSGHKADFGLLALDADPLKIDGLYQRLLAGPLGPALVPTASFVSLTEVSEHVPSVERYAAKLVDEGLDPASEAYREQAAEYERRFQIMRRQRLTPDVPIWPAVCFYPMNRKRQADANWFLLDFDQRDRLMGEHGQTGMTFAGKVTQLVTVAAGLDDWEWGVTLWARNPEFLKQIVYQMRFDEATARYAEFGPFYVGYLTPPTEILKHCRIGTWV